MQAALKKYQYSLNFSSPDEHFDMLHADRIGTVIVWEKLSNAWHKIQPSDAANNVTQILSSFRDGDDTYLSVNEFYGWRSTSLLKSLRANFVDIDLGRAATQFDVDDAHDALASAGMPWPSAVVFSGRGLHLYWCLQPTPASALPVWQAIQQKLIDALKPVGADPCARDCARVLRLVGTINSKNGATVRGQVLDGIAWKFHDLANNVLGFRPDKPKAEIRSFAAAAIKAGNHPKATTFRRWHLVFKDLQTIGNHYKSIPAGHRNEYLFIASIALSWFAAPESIEDEVADLARQYCPDLTEEEARAAASQSVSRATRAAAGERGTWKGEECDLRYRMKRETLFERLGELAKPVRSKMRAIVDEEQAVINKQKRDASRWDDSNTGEGVRQSNIERKQQARTLQDEGHSTREIAEKLTVNQSTVSRWLR